MEHKPSLSIIVANYNNEKCLKDCIESILAQTYEDFEIIIADDGSTDDSPGTIRDYKKRYPEVIKGIFSPANRGVARTRHEAIMQAQGAYITTLDSDDIYYNDEKLEHETNLVSAYKEQFRKDVCAFSNTVLLDEQLRFMKAEVTEANLKEGSILYELITRQCFVPRDFVFLKSAYFEVGGYDCSLLIREDWDLKIRLAKRYNFYYTGHYGTGYRRHDQGLSSSDLNEDKIRWLRKVFQKNLPLIACADQQQIIDQFEAFVQKKIKNTR